MTRLPVSQPCFVRPGLSDHSAETGGSNPASLGFGRADPDSQIAAVLRNDCLRGSENRLPAIHGPHGKPPDASHLTGSRDRAKSGEEQRSTVPASSPPRGSRESQRVRSLSPTFVTGLSPAQTLCRGARQSPKSRRFIAWREIGAQKLGTALRKESTDSIQGRWRDRYRFPRPHIHQEVPRVGVEPTRL